MWDRRTFPGFLIADISVCHGFPPVFPKACTGRTGRPLLLRRRVAVDDAKPCMLEYPRDGGDSLQPCYRAKLSNLCIYPNRSMVPRVFLERHPNPVHGRRFDEHQCRLDTPNAQAGVGQHNAVHSYLSAVRVSVSPTAVRTFWSTPIAFPTRNLCPIGLEFVPPVQARPRVDQLIGSGHHNSISRRLSRTIHRHVPEQRDNL